MELLTVKDLDFSYDNEKKVLNDLSMKFKSGKVYTIFGKSGAGKSTLLSLLAGLEKIESDNIFYKGEDISEINKDEYRSNNIGIIFQSYNLLPQLTALENVMLSMDISKVVVKDKKETALKLLKKVGLDEAIGNRKVLQLSGGEQQRVSIARALSYDCEIILADEPTGNLDEETEQDIMEILIKLAHEENKCVIIVSHSNKVKKAADILYHLVGGKLQKN